MMFASTPGMRTFTLAVALFCSSVLPAASQTAIAPPKNKFSPAQDVELGRQAAAEIEKEMPLLRDREVSRYVEQLGDRLVDVIPAPLQHPEFQYTFKVVNLREINAFALPGGPMYVNRGMIEAASSEGEVVGVMAHELSHVILRHGTAQATKAQKFQIGAVAGAILGAIVGGRTGSVISEGSQFGLGTYFLKYGREYEKQADILGAQLMARVGYDPRDLARMFETIARQGGRGGPEWLSDHPDPGNRTAYIQREAETLNVGPRRGDSQSFARAKQLLAGMSPAPKTADIARASNGGGGDGRVPSIEVDGHVDPPAARYQTYRGGQLFQVAVPENWRPYESGSAIKYAPDGAYGRAGGQAVFTHGVELGVARSGGSRLDQATDEFLGVIAQNNPGLRAEEAPARTTISGRPAYLTRLTNQSGTGRVEVVLLWTTLLRDGTLFYSVGVAPRDEYQRYSSVFDRVSRSIRLSN
jgi:beta-barrel assembly-enhancing protease